MQNKINEAKAAIEKPQVESLHWNGDMHFWCYFCKAEYERHVRVDSGVTIINAGLLKHLTEEDHDKEINAFFWENKLNKEMKEKYRISAETYSRFEEQFQTAVDQYQSAKCKQHIQEVQKIEWQERRSHHTVSQVSPAMAVAQFKQQHHRSGYIQHKRQNMPLGGAIGSDLKRIRTASAKGDGLTRVSIKSFLESEGNVHSGGLPPWLQDSSLTVGTAAAAAAV
ncbi:PREDICTED: coiled-coil domain-containing protein 84-like [Priapulus caudatus]|uniref:Coiled-coil domain-containing protein 84-like n=1 Tax=Priapulus caudatus TaxID=37621 RepID=A0ABM1F1Y8_PRICU|nr:PREDICTED: coiled-coil domain-containing protein 84-like [Priapulus caudatus]